MSTPAIVWSEEEKPTWTVVEVEWLDHAFHQGEYKQQGLSRQRSVGFLLEENEGVLTIAQSITTDDDAEGPQPCEVLVLGRSMVTRMRRL